MREQRCITGADPLETCSAPYSGEFGASDFMYAPQVEVIAQELVRSCPEFDVLEAMIDSGKFRVAYLWRKKAAKSCGKTVLGKSIKVSGYARHFSEADFVVEIAADAARSLTNYQLEAAIYHELLHIGIEYDEDEDGNETLVIRPQAHDVEMFNDEVQRYGLWKNDLADAAIAFKQAPLWERNGRTAWERSSASDEPARDRVQQLQAKGGLLTTKDGDPLETDDDLRDYLGNAFKQQVNRAGEAKHAQDLAECDDGDLKNLEPKVPVNKVELLAIAADPAKAGSAEMVQLINSGCDGAIGETVQISTSLAERWGLTPVHA